jgi:hypothetical protein
MSMNLKEMLAFHKNIFAEHIKEINKIAAPTWRSYNKNICNEMPK